MDKQGKWVGRMWIPAPTGIPGNERVDELAKEAVKRTRAEIHV